MTKRHMARAPGWLLAAAATLLAACGGGAGTPEAATAAQGATEQTLSGRSGDSHPHGASVQLRVLSSPADQVSGGDARIHVRAAPGVRDKLSLWLNGRPLAATLVDTLAEVDDGLEGVITGLVDGHNLLQLRHRSAGVRDALVLVNHPITGPIFTGPQQTPFVCTTAQFGREPKVDSDTAPGYRVRDISGNTVGYSRNCSIDSFVSYLYRSTANSWLPLPTGGARPADMSVVTLPDGRSVDFVVRREVGSINRFLYSFAMLATAGESADAPDLSLWNRKLLYWFQGGVAIGHSQGTVHSGSLNPDILRQGYAIAHSSGNNTGTHYNMNLAGETAMMTKERFIERYGAPVYTVGLGGSGGAIQQYLIAQNNPGVLDGLLPVQSYPDMVTQTIHVGDCELLEHYMDATDRANPKWRVTKNRSLLVGLNAEEGFARVNDPLAGLKTALGYSTAVGMSECVPGWRGLTPLAMNPLYGQAPNQQFYEPQSDIAAIRWTHYDDLRNVYGIDANGAARVTWDNQGVQYGLQSLRAGKITLAEFVHLNWHVGGWKHPSNMLQETFPFFGTGAAEVNKALSIPGYFDPWSSKNMLLSTTPDQPAARARGDLHAMRAAYTSGHVFSGKLDVPAIDNRQYMERELDMHNSHQSFAVRQRVQSRMRHSGNLAVWFTDTVPGTPKASQALEALAVMDEWLMNIRARPYKGVARNRPARAADSCFDTTGKLMHSGAGVWDGILDARAPGACTQAFPLYSTSRIVAGAPIEGWMYRCARKPVERAVADGSYAPWAPGATEVAQLKQIFPDGVCDYSRPDRARPRAFGHGHDDDRGNDWNHGHDREHN